MGLLHNIYAKYRKYKFKMLSDKSQQMEGCPSLYQPVLIKGTGNIVVGSHVRIGHEESAGFWNTYTYFDVRGERGLIRIGDGVMLNNNTSLTADGATIEIGANTIAGINLSIATSDGHSINPLSRHKGVFPRLPVTIGENVFLGDNVVILKGVHIGQYSVIGANSVVTKDIPEKAVAAGNPCRVLHFLPSFPE
jgi:acetyltransferase-like isoleucine patch superfamily enzyme